jgi:hypothetical protein
VPLNDLFMAAAKWRICVETYDEQSPRILHGSMRRLHVPFRFEMPGTAEKAIGNGGRYRD